MSAAIDRPQALAAGRGLVVIAAVVWPPGAGVAAVVVGQPTGCLDLVLTPALELAGGRIGFVGDWQLTDIRTGLRVGWPEPEPSWLLEMAQHLRRDHCRGFVTTTGDGGGAP